MSAQPVIDWTRPKLRRFEVAYAAAVGAGKEEFEFEGHAFVTAYAGYLIEYLRGQFGVKRGVIPNCPFCHGERELNGLGGYDCHFCGRATGEQTDRKPGGGE